MIYKEMDGNRDIIMMSQRSSDNVFITKTWSLHHTLDYR